MQKFFIAATKLTFTASGFLAIQASAVSRIVNKEEKKVFLAAVQVLHLEIPCTDKERTVYDTDGYHSRGTETQRSCEVDSLKDEVQSALAAQKITSSILKVSPADDPSAQILGGEAVASDQPTATVRVSVVFDESPTDSVDLLNK